MLKKLRLAIITTAMVVLPLSLAISFSLLTNKNNDANQQFRFDGQIFESKQDLLAYLTSNNIDIVYKNDNGEYASFHWTIDGTEQVFNNLNDLDAYIAQNYVQEMPAHIRLNSPITNSNIDNLEQDFWNKIEKNRVVPFKLDAQGQIITPDQDMGYAFQGYDGNNYFAMNKEDALAMQQKAQASWVEYHNPYLFNGIYFANKKDLEAYLHYKYQSQALDSQTLAEITNYQIVLDASATNGGGKVSYTFKTDKSDPNGIKVYQDADPNGYDGYQFLEKIVEDSIKNNSEYAFRINNNEQASSRIYTLDDLTNSMQLDQELQKELKYWNFAGQDDKSLYVIDNQKGSRGELFGNYFQASMFDLGFASPDQQVLEGVMNVEANWQPTTPEVAQEIMAQTNDSNAQMIGMLMSMAFQWFAEDHEKIDAENLFTLTEMGKLELTFAELLTYAQNHDLFTEYDIDLPDNDFIKYLNNLPIMADPYASFGTHILNLSEQLVSGKRYNAFYLLPIIRNYILSQLIVNQIDQVTLEKINNVFIALADMVSTKLQAILAPLSLDWQAFASQNQTANPFYSGLDLKLIYGFTSRSEDIYRDPSLYLNNVFNFNKLTEQSQISKSQALISKAEILGFSTIFSQGNIDLTNIVKQINDQMQNLSGHQSSPYQIAHFKLDTNLSAQIYAQVASVTTPALKAINYEQNFKAQIEEFINNINYQHQALNALIDQYNQKNQALWEANKVVIPDQEKLDALFLDLKKIGAEIFNYLIASPLYDANKIFNSDKQLITGQKIGLSLQSIINFAAKSDDAIDLAKIQEILDIAKNVNKIIAFIPQLTLVASWVGFALDAAQSVLDQINFFSTKYVQDFFICSLKNGEKILWNGGETKHFAWFSKQTYTKANLKLNNPLQLTTPFDSIATGGTGSNKTIYFDGNFYNDSFEVYLKVKSDLLNNQANPKYLGQYMNSVFGNVESIYIYPFAVPGKNANMISDQNNIKKLVKQIIYGFDPENRPLILPNYENAPGKNAPLLTWRYNDAHELTWYLNFGQSKYLETIWKTSEGYVGQDQSVEAINNYLEKLLATIKPIYLFQIPDTDENGNLVSKDFQLPYPYYASGTNKVIGIGKENPLAYLQKEYNPNLKDDISGDFIIAEDKIVDTIIKEWALKQFAVKVVKASWEAIYQAASFADIQETMISQNIFQITSPWGEINYYWNLNAAIAALKAPEMLNAQMVEDLTNTKLLAYSGPNTNESLRYEFNSIKQLFSFLLETKIVENIKL